MRRLNIEEDIPPQINIVPMIDIIFAILTFFIMSSLMLGRFEGLVVNLPTAQSSQSQKVTRATLTLDRQGKLYLNKIPLSIENLRFEVEKLRQPNQDLIVLLNADGSVTHDRVVAVMDQLRQIGVRMAIATQKP